MRIFSVIFAFIAITAGVLVLLGYFIPAFSVIQVLLLNWAVILAGVAVIVGVFNLALVHSDKVRRGEKGSIYSALLVVSLLATLIFGIFLRPGHTIMKMVVNGIIIPSEAALMGLLTISLLYAAIRLLRRRVDLMSIIFLITAAFVLLGTATLTFGGIPLIGEASQWVTQVLALGGARGILIGVSLGILMTGLRVLFGIDRPYGGN